MFILGFLFAFKAAIFLLGLAVGLIVLAFILLLIYGFFFATHYGEWWIMGLIHEWKRNNKSKST